MGEVIHDRDIYMQESAVIIDNACLLVYQIFIIRYLAVQN